MTAIKFIVQKKLWYIVLAGSMLLVTAMLLSSCQRSKSTNVTEVTKEEKESNVTKAAGEKGKAANKSKFSLDLGETKVLPILEGEKITSCHSDKKNVISASSSGQLHALKQGKAKVIAEIETENGTESRAYHIEVKKRGMVYPVFSMMKGEHLDLQYSKEGIQAVWKSKNPAVASVTKAGRVTAKKKGKAVLIAKTKQGKTYRCQLTVTKRIESVIYLTFDDGPNRYSTTKVLNVLKKNNIKATFFELKPAKADFDLTKRVLDEGHSLAMHGYQHKYDIVYRSQKIYHENLDKLRDLFFQKFGVWCTVSRFPGGSSNTSSRYNPGIMTKITNQIHDWGYHYFDWNVDSEDAGGARTANDVYNNVIKSLQKGRGNVVLMHDYQSNDKTIDALERIIRYGKKNGYTFLPITASTDEVHHGVNN